MYIPPVLSLCKQFLESLIFLKFLTANWTFFSLPHGFHAIHRHVRTLSMSYFPTHSRSNQFIRPVVCLQVITRDSVTKVCHCSESISMWVVVAPNSRFLAPHPPIAKLMLHILGFCYKIIPFLVLISALRRSLGYAVTINLS